MYFGSGDELYFKETLKEVMATLTSEIDLTGHKLLNNVFVYTVSMQASAQLRKATSFTKKTSKLDSKD